VIAADHGISPPESQYEMAWFVIAIAAGNPAPNLGSVVRMLKRCSAAALQRIRGCPRSLDHPQGDGDDTNRRYAG
jgi:hypothetical protein